MKIKQGIYNIINKLITNIENLAQFSIAFETFRTHNCNVIL